MTIFDLRDVSADLVDRVGGKAANLGELLRAGERVPPGFCLPAEVTDLPKGQIIAAYDRLGGGPVAVRSSATVEDAPGASYAGMFDTVLDVHGPEALLAAIEACRASASNAHAAAYAPGEIHMGVVVQRMVPAERAGVLFTANPLTGCRTEMLVESAPGPGSTVVDGHTDVDRHVLTSADPLWAVGQRLQALFGSPQDVEWAVDEHGELWILQSRPITTLFPAPPPTDGPPRLYLEFGHVQGMLQPATPMGMDTLRQLIKAMLAPLGLRVEIIDIGGRLYGDLSDLVRDPVARRRLIPLMAVDFGPRAQAVVRHVLDDPRFAPGKGPKKKREGNLPPIGRAVRGVLGALADPEKARARLDAAVERIRLSSVSDAGHLTTADRLRLVRDHDQTDGPDAIIWPIVAGMLAGALPPRLLGDVAQPGEIHTVLGGMPHNVTIEMDLALWALARDAADPETVDLTGFLARYGHRAAAEVDLGVPRWSEDPAPVRAALANLMRLTDPEQAPDHRFARAAEQAEAALVTLGARARRRRPVRGRLAIFLLNRARRLAGLREAGKFAGLYRIAEMRRHLLAIGTDLTNAAVLSHPDDIMFLTLDEAETAARLADRLSSDPLNADASGHHDANESRDTNQPRRPGESRGAVGPDGVDGSRGAGGPHGVSGSRGPGGPQGIVELRKSGGPDFAGGSHRLGEPHGADGRWVAGGSHGVGEPLEAGDYRQLVAERRAEHERELRRRSVPVALLSDGTDVEAVLPAAHDPGALRGVGASAGRATGRVRVVHDPATAHLEPGEVLVTATTDPGWTPLFLTAAALVTETGAVMAHGPTVAREYGIPAVICVPGATERLRTGQLVTVDAAAGTVTVVTDGASIVTIETDAVAEEAGTDADREVADGGASSVVPGATGDRSAAAAGGSVGADVGAHAGRLAAGLEAADGGAADEVAGADERSTGTGGSVAAEVGADPGRAAAGGAAGVGAGAADKRSAGAAGGPGDADGAGAVARGLS
ncbi:PEP-utilizing enzyme [Actinoplanes sp. TRM 88003]|uniref:PEP-utilizing enzyme n=1 Tax=Paractinoplanes aksuensis TaxID=2939490 RepID=A0ABT1DGH5_9ACTN|nr:PEP/pyruvate-binding domain-containing protein [Actinoplanes aksuensis]MCO8269943.1 PEP-utilizing enzyme [Actinoplanes aksuensis]